MLPSSPSSGQRMSSQENLLRAVVVLLVGHVQAYLQHIMEEFTDSLPNDWASLTELQRIYVVRQVHRRLTRALNQYEEVELADPRKLERFIKNVGDTAGWVSQPGQLALSGERDTLQGFFGDFGTNAIVRYLGLLRGDNKSFFQWLEDRNSTYSRYPSLLSNLIEIRNDAAHGRTTRRLTLREAREFRVVAVRLVDFMDRFVQGA